MNKLDADILAFAVLQAPDVENAAFPEHCRAEGKRANYTRSLAIKTFISLNPALTYSDRAGRL